MLDGIVKPDGKPTNLFLEYFNQDFAGAIELADRDIFDEIDRLDAILAGTGEPFTGLLVGSQNVKPFLDKTNGTALTDTTGLGTAVVTAPAIATSAVITAKVAANAITSEASAFTAATLPVVASTAETTVQTVAFTTTGQTTEVKANFFMTMWHPTAGNVNVTLRIYRDATLIYSQVFVAINGDLLQGWQTPTVIESPAAAAYTYSVTMQSDVNNYATFEASSRLLAVREYKR
jgi:hypothetical protein